MSITTTSLLPPPIQQSFSLKLLSVPTPYFIHTIPAEMKRMPKNGGSVLRCRRYNPLASAPVPLGNSGITPPPQNLTAMNIDVPIQFYGTYILCNEQVTLQAQDPVLNEASIRLGVSLRQTEDQLMRDMLLSTSSMMNCQWGLSADVPTEITRIDLDRVVRQLRNANAYSFMSGIQGEDRIGTSPVRDAYMALGHTNLIGQLDAMNGFVHKWTYPNQQSTLESEWGTCSNVRFLLSSAGSITKNASLLGQDIYNIFICGKESFTTVEQDGFSTQFLYRPAIYNGPLAQDISLGWKMGMGNRILNDAWIVNLRCVTR